MLENNKNIENIIKDNMMDYSAYVNLNRAIPDVRDGYKPIYRRIIFTMHKMKASKFTKSANVSGEVMKVSPHGDCYDTIVNMVQSDRQLTPPLVGKGNFSSYTSRDLQYGASRYTEVKLGDISLDTLSYLNNKSVKFIPNYDGTIMMPEVLPVRFPMILHNAQEGIGVGMASKIPSFSMKEIADAIDSYINLGEKIDLIPDFATGGLIINNKNTISKINNNGIGTVYLRGKCSVENNIIKIEEIPYSTTREAIIDKIIELIKEGKIKDILDVKDLTGIDGMCIKITCKKHCNAETVLNKLYKMTPLESTFNANMNVLCDGLPKVMGVWDIIDKWIEWRIECIKRTYKQDIKDLKSQLHLYNGLLKIIDNINFIIETIRKSESDEYVLKELCDKFDVDIVQAEYIINMKIRNLNKNYINKYISDKKDLENKIYELEKCINNDNEIKKIILKEIHSIANKYGKSRMTKIIDETEVQEISKDVLIEDYNCRILYTNKYIKKHLKQSDSHKIKEDEIILGDITSNNKDTIMIFTNKGNRHRINCNDLDTVSPSSYGQYIPSIIKLSEGEEIIKIVSIPPNPKGYIVAVYENGKTSKVDINSFLSNNKILSNCYNTESKLIDIDYIQKDVDILTVSSEGKVLIFNTDKINAKGSRSTQGNISIKLNEDHKCVNAIINTTKDNKITLHTSKGKDIYTMLDDVSPNDNKNWYDYLSGKTGNQGNFVYNTRTTNDLVTKVTIE